MIKNNISGKYLSVDWEKEEVTTSTEYLGINSQWAWKSKNGNGDVWGDLSPVSRPVRHYRPEYHLVIKNCECPVERSICEKTCQITLQKLNGYRWRRIGNQIFGIEFYHIPYFDKGGPYFIGHDSEGYVRASRGAMIEENNGEWSMINVVPGMLLNTY